MADNYLERQREQYEARKAAWEKSRRTRKRKVQAKRPAQRPDDTSHPTEPEVTGKEDAK